MLKKYAKRLGGVFRLFDFLIVLVSFYVAYYIRFAPIDVGLLGVQTQFHVFFLGYVVAWIYLSSRFQLYVPKRLATFRDEAWRICNVTALCLIIAAVPAFFVREFPLSRLFLIYLWPFQTGSLVFSRFVLREMLKYIRSRGYDYRQVLIVGRNDRAAGIAKKIRDTPEFGLRILGFIDASNGKERCDDPSDFNLIGKLDDLEKIMREQVVDEVFVTLPFKSFYAEIERTIRICESVGVEVKIPIDFFNLKLAKNTISRYDDIPVIDLYTSPKMNLQLIIKRVIDVVVSAILLALISPLLFVVGILIKSTSKGPIFFKQQRVGYNGRLFNCLKFRTMIENAEELKSDLLALNEMDGPVFKLKNDPRVTKVGRILRKTSMDELPQFINVLKGDMSLVGPRPPVPWEVDQYHLTDRRRLSMKPGITCIWQVSGRNTIPFEKWMELDKDYIDHWSLSLDLKILLKTIPAVLRGSGM